MSDKPTAQSIAVARNDSNTLSPPPGTLYVRINMDPKNPAGDDKFRLFSTDGSYSQTKTIRDDLISGDDFLDLLFTDLLKGLRYSLEVITGSQPPYCVFQDVPYDQVDSISPCIDSVPAMNQDTDDDVPGADDAAVENEDSFLVSMDEMNGLFASTGSPSTPTGGNMV